jgi:subtilisin family serine protease
MEPQFLHELPNMSLVIENLRKSTFRNIIIEIKPSMNFAISESMDFAIDLEKSIPLLNIDKSFSPIPVKSVVAAGENGPFDMGQENYLVKATTSAEQISFIEMQENVVKIWEDSFIQPFPCPISPCDCTASTPKGNLLSVANYLGVDKIWAQGHKGEGVVVGVVDGGITANGRLVVPGETSKRIDHVTDGYPADWGTTAKNWNEHGNMCATDVQGMAPNVRLMDIRISGAAGVSGGTGSVISNAIAGYQWCINKHHETGAPNILTNSWGIYQSAWDPVYATDPTHPFTRKVEEAINEGIIVLFAAGNCGDTCGSSNCGNDKGPGKSIWGANGHPKVMTVGAANINEEFVGYSSQGPAALDPAKPDFCSITHFTGYFNCDNGTSAATPVAAGVVALFKQAKPALTQEQIKNALKSTAKDIGPAGWDSHSGAGIIQAKSAFDTL